MKTHARVKILLGMLFSILLCSVQTRAQSTQGSFTKQNPKGKKAYALPMSDRDISLEVTMPNDTVLKLLLKEGAMAKVGDLDKGFAYALIPKVTNLTEKTVSTTIYILSQDAEGNESVREIEHLDAGWQTASRMKAEPQLRIRVLSITEGKPTGEPGAQLRTGSMTPVAYAEKQKDCCVTCDGIWACATCVWMSCGCCCDSPYKCTTQPPPNG